MTDSDNPTFTESTAQAIWANYMDKVDRLCGPLDKRQKTDIKSEIKAHLLESFIQINAGDEASRISAATEKLGRPEEFVPLWVEERLLDGAQPGSSARNLFQLSKINALKGAKQFLFTMTVGLGYLLAFYFFVISILKLFFPDHVGLYLSPGGIPFVGYVDAEEFTELMGNWLAPVGIVASLALNYVLNKLVKQWIGRTANNRGETR